MRFFAIAEEIGHNRHVPPTQEQDLATDTSLRDDDDDGDDDDDDNQDKDEDDDDDDDDDDDLIIY